jgi:hypothetical protein
MYACKQLLTRNSKHYFRPQTFANMKLQEGPADPGTPQFPHEKKQKFLSRKSLENVDKLGVRKDSCSHVWVPHFDGGVWLLLFVVLNSHQNHFL